MWFMNWIAEHGVELAGFVLTLVVTIAGWVMEHRSSKERDNDRRDDIDLLKSQIAALRDQADSLNEQTAMQRAEFDKPPFGEAEWVRGSIRRVTITGSRRVYVESVTLDDDSYVLRLRTKIPDSFEPSETIEYVTNGPVPVVFSWRWDDEPNMPLKKLRRVTYTPEQ